MILSSERRMMKVWRDQERHGSRPTVGYDQGRVYEGRTRRLPGAFLFIGRRAADSVEGGGDA